MPFQKGENVVEIQIHRIAQIDHSQVSQFTLVDQEIQHLIKSNMSIAEWEKNDFTWSVKPSQLGTAR